MATISFSGIASGIDTDGLIKATLDAARTQRIKPSEEKVTKLTDTSDTLEQLKTKLDDLRSKLRDFSSLAGGALSKQGTSEDETILTATASKSALNGTYSLTVTQKAKNGTFSFDDRFADTSTIIDPTISDVAPADPNRTVSFTLGTSDPKTVNVTMTSTMTAAGFVTEFNTQSLANGSRATASLVNVGTAASPSYAIVINSAKEGLAEGEITLNSVGAEIAPAFAANTLSQATDAELSVSGITGTITRSSNAVTDVIAGVTLNLNSTGTTTVTITDDSAATAGKIQDWVDDYNEIVQFIAENNQITRQEDGSAVSNVFAPLSTQRVDDSFLSQFRSNIAAASADAGTAINIMADLGFETQRDGTLKFNSETFQTAVATSSSSANSILLELSDATSLTGGTIDIYTRFNGMFDNVINSNKEQISDLNKRISEAESSIARQEESLRARYARLEGIIGSLNQQQSTLASALAGLR